MAPLEEDDAEQEEELEEITLEDEEDVEPLRTAKDRSSPQQLTSNYMIAITSRLGIGASGATSAADAAHPIDTLVDRWSL